MLVNRISLGMGAAIAACAFWGLVFLAPKLTPGFTPLQLSAGRYLAYGLVAATLIAPSWRRLRLALTWTEWRALIWLSLAGNIIYYLFLAKAVQAGGVAMPSLIIGLLPIAVTLVGSRDRHAVPLRRLAPSLALSAAGLACISWQSLATGGHESLVGVFCALGALVSWTMYAVNNSRWLARLHKISAQDWSLLTGVVTGALALLLAAPAFWAQRTHGHTEWMHFAGVIGAIAIFCSVIGNALWNYASRALPLALMGQMIVFETLFAALYGYVWEQRWPTTAESLAMLLLIAGVISCAAAHRSPAPASGMAEPV